MAFLRSLHDFARLVLREMLMTACFLPAAGEALPAGASLDSSTRRPPSENQDRRQDRLDDRHDRR
jgi:hypothetical protein